MTQQPHKLDQVFNHFTGTARLIEKSGPWKYMIDKGYIEAKTLGGVDLFPPVRFLEMCKRLHLWPTAWVTQT